MCASPDIRDIDKSATEGPQSALERKYIQEYLENQGTNLESLSRLPKDEMQRLMREACKYSSLKLAEVESRAKFRHAIIAPS
jgi:hypothetical protein